MTTKELRKKLKIAQVPANGSRLELERRFNEFRKKTLAEAGLSSSDEEEEASPDDDTTHPAIIMLDHQCGNRYMRVVGQKGLGDKGEMQWLVKACMKNSNHGVSPAGITK